MTTPGFGPEQSDQQGRAGSGESGWATSKPPYGSQPQYDSFGGYGPSDNDIYASGPYAGNAGSQPSPPQPAYGQGPNQPGYVPAPYYDQGSAQRTNGVAIAALVCGIGGMMVPGASIAAIVLGHLGLSSVNRTGEGGRGMALAGMILGYVITVLGVLFILLIILGIALGDETSNGAFTS